MAAPDAARRSVVGYVVAAYGIVIGSLGWYAWRVQRQRRELMQREDSARASGPES
jgi:hypothetical protein